jgi:hypothetical protein
VSVSLHFIDIANGLTNKSARRMGFSWLFSGMPYGPAFKARRTLFHTHFQPKAILKYHPVIVGVSPSPTLCLAVAIFPCYGLCSPYTGGKYHGT